MTNMIIGHDLTKMWQFLCSLACESWSPKSGNLCPDWNQESSGQSHLNLNRTVWTLCKGSPLEKNLNLRPSNCWKCIEIVNPTIITLFCIILNIFRSLHQVGLFGSWGGGGLHVHPPAYGPDMNTIQPCSQALSSPEWEERAWEWGWIQF